MRLDDKTNEELLEIQKSIESDPRNKAEGVFRFTPRSRQRLDAIARQITHNLAMKRKAEGRPVPVEGYSGRRSNKPK